jgi:hypothetical protein
MYRRRTDDGFGTDDALLSQDVTAQAELGLALAEFG